MRQMVKMMAQTEAQMNAIERIKEYVDTIDPEPPMITDVRPPADWPLKERLNSKMLNYVIVMVLLL